MRRLILSPKIRFSLFLILGAFLLNSCYLVQQGSYFLKDQWQALDISQVKEASLQALVQRSEEIRSFSQEVLGLTAGDSYTKLRITDKDYLVDVVSAVADDAFERYYWRYPLFGKLPYRGFYRREDALRLAQRLQKKDLDVFVRKVDGFSAHGYFPDLLFSFMQDYSSSGLARLIIHELAHSTLWIKRNSQFNEEFASFVGREGSLSYLSWKYGEDSGEYRYEIDLRQDGRRFREKIIALKTQLQAVYQSNITREEKLQEKAALITSFQQQFAASYAADFLTPAYQGMADFPLDNAYLDLFSTYEENQDLFHQLYLRFDEDLPAVLRALVREKDRMEKDPYQLVRSLSPP